MSYPTPDDNSGTYTGQSTSPNYGGIIAAILGAGTGFVNARKAKDAAAIAAANAAQESRLKEAQIANYQDLGANRNQNTLTSQGRLSLAQQKAQNYLAANSNKGEQGSINAFMRARENGEPPEVLDALAGHYSDTYGKPFPGYSASPAQNIPQGLVSGFAPSTAFDDVPNTGTMPTPPAPGAADAQAPAPADGVVQPNIPAVIAGAAPGAVGPPAPKSVYGTPFVKPVTANQAANNALKATGQANGVAKTKTAQQIQIEKATPGILQFLGTQPPAAQAEGVKNLNGLRLVAGMSPLAVPGEPNGKQLPIDGPPASAAGPINGLPVGGPIGQIADVTPPISLTPAQQAQVANAGLATAMTQVRPKEVESQIAHNDAVTKHIPIADALALRQFTQKQADDAFNHEMSKQSMGIRQGQLNVAQAAEHLRETAAGLKTGSDPIATAKGLDTNAVQTQTQIRMWTQAKNPNTAGTPAADAFDQARTENINSLKAIYDANRQLRNSIKGIPQPEQYFTTPGGTKIPLSSPTGGNVDPVNLMPPGTFPRLNAAPPTRRAGPPNNATTPPGVKMRPATSGGSLKSVSTGDLLQRLADKYKKSK